MPTPEGLFAELQASREKRLPPVEKWDPAQTGDSQMRIATDGRWFYQGSEIQRPEMVRLFSTILRRDGDRYFLVTPVEKLEIEVEDAPFVATDMETRGQGHEQEIVFVTNVDDYVVADGEHPIRVAAAADDPKPYLHVRAGLDARISRPVYYRLIEIAEEHAEADKRIAHVRSCGESFVLGEYRV